MLAAGMLAYMPIQKASTIHTTIHAAIVGQERIVTAMIGPVDPGATRTFTIIPDNNVNLAGVVEAVITDPGGAGNPDVDIACVNDANASINLSLNNDLDLLNEKRRYNLAADCDAVQVLIPDPTDAIAVFVTIKITNWPEV